LISSPLAFGGDGGGLGVDGLERGIAGRGDLVELGPNLLEVAGDGA
jgi:hypothetical protein